LTSWRLGNFAGPARIDGALAGSGPTERHDRNWQRCQLRVGDGAAIPLDSRPGQRHTAAMPKPVKIALAILLVAAVGVVTWQGLRPQEREPVYQGKRLSVWLRDLPRTGEATNALRHLGTNAIPTLLKMLEKEDSFWVSELTEPWARHVTHIRWLPDWVRSPDWYRNQASVLNEGAVRGFEILGSAAQQTAPALTNIYEQNLSPRSQLATGRALNAIGPEAQRVAIPSFLRAAASSNARVRELAVMALHEIRVEPHLVVPALARSLGDTNYLVRIFAADGLAKFGTNAQRAVPALLPLLTDPNVITRSAATNTFKAIDPEAAAKAGVK
jgi:hypothetical protein